MEITLNLQFCDGKDPEEKALKYLKSVGISKESIRGGGPFSDYQSILILRAPTSIAEAVRAKKDSRVSIVYSRAILRLTGLSVDDVRIAPDVWLGAFGKTYFNGAGPCKWD